MTRLTRRALVGGAGATVLAGTAGRSDAASPSVTKVDVVVVGAGLSGLMAARTLHAGGARVVVLEARSRVGGRNLDEAIGKGEVAELGGQWIGPGQTRIMALAKELGIKTFLTYESGSSIYRYGGQTHTYSGDIPPASPAALAEIEAALLLINQMAQSVSADTPWTAPRAKDWDCQSVQTWINDHIHTSEAKFLVGLAVRGVYGEEPTQVSLLDLLCGVTGVGGDMNTLIGSAQSVRFVGGPQQISRRLAAALGSRVHLQSPVLRIERGEMQTVHTAHAAFQARHVVIAVPKPNLAAIQFAPLLPPALVQWLQRQPSGATTKVEVVYDTPWWRSKGLNGSAVGDLQPIEIVYDNSPDSGDQGVLVGFLEGDRSRKYFGRRGDRKAAVLDCLATYLGEQARSPRLYLEKVWPEDPYAQGAYGSFNPPGVITSLGAEATQPLEGLHLVGADFSGEWPGYMEGALRSGEKAARAILAR